jgi:hypothetical protein
MTPQEAYETTKGIITTWISDLETDPDDVDQDDLRDFMIGEAAGWLADLDTMPEVRQAALRGLIAGAGAAGFPDLFHDERDLADQMAEALNTAL